MTERWSIEQAREYFANRKPHTPTKKKQSNKGVMQIKLLLDIEGVQYVQEHKFSKDRKFRFDFAIPEKKIAIEFEGIMSAKSRHTSKIGYSKDTEKYNLAAAEGWKVFRYTILTYGKMIEEIKPLL